MAERMSPVIVGKETGRVLAEAPVIPLRPLRRSQGWSLNPFNADFWFQDGGGGREEIVFNCTVVTKQYR